MIGFHPSPSRGPLDRMARTVAGAFVLLALAGCTSDRAIPEFKLYLSTYEATAETVTTVLNEFEGAELDRARDQARRFGMTPLRSSTIPAEERPEARRVGRERIRLNGGFDDTFHIEDSVYFASNAVPPITAAFRRAFAAVGAYNDVVDAYAEGRALDEIRAELGGLASAVGALGETLSLGGAVLANLAPGGGLVSSGLGIIDMALEGGSREAFRQAIIALEPEIDSTLATMRGAAPAMFDIITEKRRNAAKDAAAAGNAAEAEKHIEAIEKYRVVLSNWVVALTATEEALDEVVAAIRAPDTALSILSDLTATTQNAAAVTEQTRRLLGEIRTDL